MLPSTINRVPDNTADEVNQKIRRRTEEHVARTAAGGPHAIDRRLAELEREWDIERYVETLAPSFTLFGMLMAATGSKRWLILPAAVQTFFLQHALQGWCPPIPLLRRLGVRTIHEIEQERYALKALRGDFRRVGDSAPRESTEALEAVRR